MERVPFDGGEGVEGNRFLSRVHREWERLSVSFNNAPLTVCTHTFAYSFVICIKGCSSVLSLQKKKGIRCSGTVPKAAANNKVYFLNVY